MLYIFAAFTEMEREVSGSDSGLASAPQSRRKAPRAPQARFPAG